MSLNRATFPPHQQPAGVLSIWPSSEDHEIVSMEVGDQFSDSEHFKDALRNFAIKHNFNCTFIKNDKQRVTVKCAAEGCEWRAHASMEGCRPLLYLDGTYLLGKYGGFVRCNGKRWERWSKGLINAIAKVFPSSPHAYCLRHLEANFMKANVKLGKSLKERCWSILSRIAFSCAEKEFDDIVADLLNTSVDAHQWLVQKSDLAHWANYMFKGERWGEMYSNVAESFNAWIKEARLLLVTNMVDSIRWQVYGIPRKHACAAILQTDINIHRYVDDYFTVDSYRQAYAEAIFPVPDNDKPDDINRELLVHPPITKKPVGRPRQKRLESQTSIIRELRCSRWHDAGHNRRSCNASIAD
ncbi:uncharacterized protein LOC120250246 [Dioscorea cayenensis subsp. rotundata]|uniref:Uncharacterized protein LOC120250246 n=1 Tax=Dioscorea cayennensis subsp. rotundata TaxID=55577 RepID=A0AB40AJN0_DIOCR|nr:uncharacterized protein LOC120250246 [Dioscorea cayenensis subsp. rotundata]